MALGGAAVLLLIHAAGLGTALEYRRDWLAGQPWRLLTGNWVHINWRHALADAAAWVAMARLYAPELRPGRQAVVILAACTAIGFSFAFCEPTLAWYRGFSGVLHALFAAGAILWLAADRGKATGVWRLESFGPWILLGLLGVKVLAESLGWRTGDERWVGAPLVARAHLVGALAGVLAGGVLAAAQRVGAMRRRSRG